MADPTLYNGQSLDDLAAQARRAESDELQRAQAGAGSIQVKQEQDGYQNQIDSHRDAGGSATAPPDAQPGFLSRATSATLKFGKDLVTHPIDDAEHGWNGAMSSLSELSVFADQMISKIPGIDAATQGVHNVMTQIDPNWDRGATDVGTHEQFKDYMENNQASPFNIYKNQNLNKDNSAGNLIEGVTQFVTGKAAIAAATGGTGTLAQAGQSIGTMVAAFNPNDPHLADLLSKFPALSGVIPDALKAKSDDTEWEGRLKGALDGLGFEVAGKVVGGLVSWIKGVRGVQDAAADQRGIEKVTPLKVDTTAAPAPEPEVKPEGDTAVPAEPKPPKAWEPPKVDGADTANPKGNATIQKVVPEGEAAANEQVFDPAKVAKQLVVSKENSEAVMKAINAGDYLNATSMLDDTHRTMPWESMSDGANMKGVFNAVEDQMGQMIKDAHGTAPMAREQVQQLANALGGDVNVLSRLYKGTTGENGLAARIMAGYNIMLASGRQLKEVAAKARDLDASTPDGAQAALDFQKQLQLHAGIVGQVRQSSAEIGRALWAHRYLKANSDVALSGISEYAGTLNGTDAIKKLAKRVADGDNLSDLTNAADQLRGKGWKGVLQEVAQNGMLSSPTTQVTNIMGNIGNSLLKVGERYVAAGVGSLRNVVAPGSDVATFREAWAHTMGAYDGLKNGAKLAWEAMKDENFTSKFSPPTSRAIQVGDGSLSLTDALTAPYSAAVNAVGKAIRWPGRFMGLFDHFTQSIGYEGDISARSYVQAAKEADSQGFLNEDSRNAFMNNRMAELRANPTTEMEQGAMAAGKYSSFLEDPATKFGGNLMKALNSVPIIKLLVAPFIHRPGNMLRQGIGDYTGLAPLFDKNRAALAAGGSSTDLALARMTIGTGTILGSYELAGNGSIVGQRLGNKNTESLDGVPPYSAKIGSSWYKFDRMDPVGLWLGLGADLHEAIQHHYDPNDPDATQALTKAATSAVQAISHVAMDKSFMKSVQDVTSAVLEKDPTRADILAEKLISDNVAKLLPFSGLARSIAHGTDDSARVSNGSGSLFDGVVSSIPYLSQDLPARKDLLGRPVPAMSWWNPFNGAPGNTDKMDQELSKLALNINAPSRTINGYTLNSHEWDEVIKNATQAPIIGGMKLEDALRSLTNSGSWDNNAQAPDGGQMRNGGYAQSLINSAYNYGRAKYLMDHQSFNEQKQQEALTKFKASVVQYNQPTQQPTQAQPQ